MPQQLLELLGALLATGLALSLKPWRLLAGGHPVTPALATLAVLPWLWALPGLYPLPLQLRLSGACLVLLMLGWPLAIPVLVGVGVIAMGIGGLTLAQALALTWWEGIVPATFALGLGAAIRRWLPDHLFIYVLGRGFIGAALCVFAAGVLAHLAGRQLPTVDPELNLVARWLMAWGDAFLTGMLVAIFVAFRPQWLATWSDRRYLR